MVFSVRNIVVLFVLCLSVFLPGCSFFEMVNNANPLPKDYKKNPSKGAENYFGDKKNKSYQQELYNVNGDTTTFKQWHDNQNK